MNRQRDTVGEIVNQALSVVRDDRRTVIAVAGPPGAGKTTFAAGLVTRLDAAADGEIAAVLPMDGFHFDNAVIAPRGLLARKGAPETFDVRGYRAMLADLRNHPEAEIAVPVFDRALDVARAGARVIGPHHRIVVTEGNYLLLAHRPWADLAALFDITVMLETAAAELERRLIQRWLDHGHDTRSAMERARGNDMTNGQLVVEESAAADFILRSDDDPSPQDV